MTQMIPINKITMPTKQAIVTMTTTVLLLLSLVDAGLLAVIVVLVGLRVPIVVLVGVMIVVVVVTVSWLQLDSSIDGIDKGQEGNDMIEKI